METSSNWLLPCMCACCRRRYEIFGPPPLHRFIHAASDSGFAIFDGQLQGIALTDATPAEAAEISIGSRLRRVRELADMGLLTGPAVKQLDRALRLAKLPLEARRDYYFRRLARLGVPRAVPLPPKSPEEVKASRMRHYFRFHAPDAPDYCPHNDLCESMIAAGRQRLAASGTPPPA